MITIILNRLRKKGYMAMHSLYEKTAPHLTSLAR